MLVFIDKNVSKYNVYFMQELSSLVGSADQDLALCSCFARMGQLVHFHRFHQDEPSTLSRVLWRAPETQGQEEP